MSRGYDIVTDRILALLDQGIVPWRKPWNAPPGLLPQNAFTHRPYRGVNSVLLGLSKYTDPRWATFHQVREHGGFVHLGEKGTPIVFWKQHVVEVDDPEQGAVTKTIPLLKVYYAFNVQQTTLELPPLAIGDGPEPNAIADAIVAGMPTAPAMAHDGGDRAFYSPTVDKVSMPVRGAFKDGGEYYCILFHELTHATGHSKRLDRGLDSQLAPFGSADYSKEELVAEFGSSFLCHQAGIENTLPNSAAYIASWAKAIRNDRTLIVHAAAKAQKAADYILGEA